MKWFNRSFLLLSLALVSGTGVALATESKPVAPKRIVTLVPSLAEWVMDLGVPESELVGVSAYTDFPASLKAKPIVGPYSRPSIEKIVELRPDLILASRDGTPKEITEKLKALGLRVVVAPTETLAAIRESYPLIAKSLAREAEGVRALKVLDAKIAEVRARSEARMKTPGFVAPRVLLQVGEDPLIIAAGKNFLNEGLELVGAKNAYPDMNQAYPRVSVEDVLTRNPDRILLIALGDDWAPFEKAKKRWEAFPSLRAVKTNGILILRSDALVRPGPRFADGLKALENTIWGGK